MKKTFIAIAALSLLVLTACGGSKKGEWNDEDKNKAQTEVDKVRGDIEGMLGDKTQAYLDCYLEKIEDNYDNFDAANADEPGCTELAQQCMTEISQ